MRAYRVPSSEEMLRMGKRQRDQLSKLLLDSIVELGTTRISANLAVQAAIEKRKQLARVKTESTGLYVSTDMIEASELLEQMDHEDAAVTAQRRRVLEEAMR